MLSTAQTAVVICQLIKSTVLRCAGVLRCLLAREEGERGEVGMVSIRLTSGREKGGGRRCGHLIYHKPRRRGRDRATVGKP